MTKQEMFDKAYRGLASQGWAVCSDQLGCVYALTEDGPVAWPATGGHNDKPIIARCAWGWVDPDNTATKAGSVRTLANHGIGVAATLEQDELLFALDLQAAHDRCNPYTTKPDVDAPWRGRLKESMHAFAEEKGLTIPQL